jgi:DNA gyrase subunit A
VTGIRLADRARVIAFGAWAPGAPGVVVTLASESAALLDAGGSLKVTRGEVFPAKGRATGGVRAHRFLKGQDQLSRGWVTTWPALGAGSNGEPVDLPDPDDRRDGSGAPCASPPAAVAARL